MAQLLHWQLKSTNTSIYTNEAAFNKTCCNCIPCIYSNVVLNTKLHIYYQSNCLFPCLNNTRRWHVTISCQPDGRPPQPVRPWKSRRVHLAEGSNVVVLELPYSTEFGRESRKFVGGVRKYGKFDDGR